MLGKGLRLRRRQIIGVLGKYVRMPSKCPFLIHRFVDDGLQHSPRRGDEPGLDVAQPPFNVKSRWFHGRCSAEFCGRYSVKFYGRRLPDPMSSACGTLIRPAGIGRPG
jgi:hypothetical protein